MAIIKCKMCGGELILVEGAGHGTSFLKDRARVEPRLLAFFQRNLSSEVTL